MTREISQLEAVGREMPPMHASVQEKLPEGAGVLMDFIDEKYFENFLNKLDAIEEANAVKPEAERVNISEIGESLGIDIAKMRSYVDEKIPYLVEKINAMANKEDIRVVKDNSMQDILGNSIITIFNRIIWVMENFHNADPAVQEKISNPQSNTRKIIDLYVKSEVQSGLASYYLDSLCADGEKLKMEISTKEGFLKNYQEYFNDINRDGQIITYQPGGGKKLPYFKFFNELEMGNINSENIEEMLSGLDEKIVNMEKIRQSELIRKIKKED